MIPKFEIGEKVTVTSVSGHSSSSRNSALNKYAGQIGKITNYYWMKSPKSEVFYLYTVQISTSSKDIVLYEDEIEGILGHGTEP